MFNNVFLGDRIGEIGFNDFRGVLGFPAILWSISMDYTARGMGKTIGPVLIATIPLLLLVRGVDRHVKYFLAFALITAVLWYFGVQRPRHFLTTLAMLYIVSGYTIVMLLQHRRILAILLLSLILAATSLNFVTWGRHNAIVPEMVTYPAGLESREQFLEERIGRASLWYPDYDILQYIRTSLPENAILVGTPSSGAAYYIDRPIYGRSLAMTTSAFETLCDLKSHDITHLWVNYDLIDYLVPKGLSNSPAVYWPTDSNFRKEYLNELYTNSAQAIYSIAYPERLDCSATQDRPWYP